MMVKSVLQWVWKMADIAATDFIRHLHIHQIFLVKWFPSFEKTIRCEYHCQEYHNSAAIQRYDCYVMWWWDMGSADSSHRTLHQPGAGLPCHHAHDRHDNVTGSAPVVPCNGRHNCLTTKPNWPWLAAWLPTAPRKYRCRRGVVWWRDAAAGSRLGSCEGVTQNTHRGYTLQILCSPLSVEGQFKLYVIPTALQHHYHYPLE